MQPRLVAREFQFAGYPQHADAANLARPVRRISGERFDGDFTVCWKLKDNGIKYPAILGLRETNIFGRERSFLHVSLAAETPFFCRHRGRSLAKDLPGT